MKKLLCTTIALSTSLCLFGCGSNAVTNTELPTNTEATVTAETVTNTDVEVNTETSSTDSQSSDEFHIVSSFFPMHILAMNLTKDISGVTESSMSEPNIGCIHDHTFTAEDLKNIEGADAYIENGLALEAFNDKIKEAYPEVNIIEASTNIVEQDVNPHVWTNIDSYISQVQYVSEQLQVLNPQNKDQYASNETAYVEQLEQLKEEYKEKLTNIAGKKVLVLDEALPGFCDYTKLETIEIETDHEEEALSADDLKDSIKTMLDENIKIILIAKDTDCAVAETIANETGATIYELNTCMVGSADSTADSYLTEMKENFEIIVTIEE